jgi:hypothetical protein
MFENGCHGYMFLVSSLQIKTLELRKVILESIELKSARAKIKSWNLAETQGIRCSWKGGLV